VLDFGWWEFGFCGDQFFWCVLVLFCLGFDGLEYLDVLWLELAEGFEGDVDRRHSGQDMNDEEDLSGFCVRV